MQTFDALLTTLLCVFLTAGASSCDGRHEQNLQGLVGKTEDEVLAQMGQPETTVAALYPAPRDDSPEEKERFLREPVRFYWYPEALIAVNAEGKVLAVTPRKGGKPAPYSSPGAVGK